MAAVDDIAEVHAALEKSIEDLSLVWQEIGVEPSAAKKELESQVRAVYERALEDAERTRNQLQTEIVEKEAKSRRIREQLQIEAESDHSQLPQQGLYEKARSVEEASRHLQARYDERLAKVRNLLEEIASVETSLGHSLSESVAAEADLTLTRCDNLQSKLEQLHNTKKQIREEIHDAMRLLASLFVQLDLDQENPTLPGDTSTIEFEKKAVAEDYDGVGVHCDTLKKIVHRVEVLQNEKELRQERLKGLAIQITGLWNRLMVDENERDAFLKEHPGLGVNTIKACEHELERLEKLKALSLKDLIARARERLTSLWDECMVSEEERSQFVPAFSDAYTDESLEAHDMAIRDMEVKAEAMRPLLKLVSKRKSLLEDQRELEQASLDPNRFRIPGRLIQEEKTRKMLKKRLPTVEAKLQEGIIEWESQYGEFVVDGTRYLDMMSQQKENGETPGRQQLDRRPKMAKATDGDSKPSARRTSAQPQQSQRRMSGPVAAAPATPVSVRKEGKPSTLPRSKLATPKTLRRPKSRPILEPVSSK